LVFLAIIVIVEPRLAILNKYKTDCKNADILNSKLFLGFLICLYDLSSKDIFKIISCFKKTWQDLKISSND